MVWLGISIIIASIIINAGIDNAITKNIMRKKMK